MIIKYILCSPAGVAGGLPGTLDKSACPLSGSSRTFKQSSFDGCVLKMEREGSAKPTHAGSSPAAAFNAQVRRLTLTLTEKDVIEMVRGRILLVDDETVFTDSLTKHLEKRGYSVTAADNGENALHALVERNFDVIVLDLKMPGMDGMAVLREIDKLDIVTETIVLTGWGAPETVVESMKLGAYDYLTKPCEVSELFSRIEGALRIKTERAEKEWKEKVKRIVESPSSVFDMVKRKKVGRGSRGEKTNRNSPEWRER